MCAMYQTLPPRSGRVKGLACETMATLQCLQINGCGLTFERYFFSLFLDNKAEFKKSGKLKGFKSSCLSSCFFEVLSPPSSRSATDKTKRLLYNPIAHARWGLIKYTFVY